LFAWHCTDMMKLSISGPSAQLVKLMLACSPSGLAFYDDGVCEAEGWDKPCIFPFTYEGVTYTECIPAARDPDGTATKPWCFYERSSDPDTYGYWDYCDDDCFEDEEDTAGDDEDDKGSGNGASGVLETLFSFALLIGCGIGFRCAWKHLFAHWTASDWLCCILTCGCIRGPVNAPPSPRESASSAPVEMAQAPPQVVLVQPVQVAPVAVGQPMMPPQLTAVATGTQVLVCSCGTPAASAASKFCATCGTPFPMPQQLTQPQQQTAESGEAV